MALIRGLLAHDAPKTYEQIFAKISSSQVVLVSGEEDNVYVPGHDDDDDDDPVEWNGMSESGTVARDQEIRFQTPTVAAGKYVFELTGDNDADLYVRIGTAPTTQLYDCRPYKTGSNETCVVELNSNAPIFVMVRGWDDSSNFQLTGSKQ
jgi:leucyl aminopeptidase